MGPGKGPAILLEGRYSLTFGQEGRMWRTVGSVKARRRAQLR